MCGEHGRQQDGCENCCAKQPKRDIARIYAAALEHEAKKSLLQVP